MNKTFFEVFPTLELDHSTYALLSKTRVERVSATKDRSAFRVFITCENLIKKHTIWLVESQIKRQLFAKQHTIVKIYERFELREQESIFACFEAYKDSILAELQKNSPIEYRAFMTAQDRYEDGILTLTLEDTFTNREIEERLREIIQKIMTERLGFSTEVRIDYRIVECTKKNREVWNEDNCYIDDPNAENLSDSNLSEINQGDQVTNISINEITNGSPEVKIDGRTNGKTNLSKKDLSKDSQKRPLKKGNNPDLLYGKDFDGNATPLEDLLDELGQVIVRGRIFKFDKRTLKSGKVMVLIDITDETDSIRIKIFLDENQADELDPAIKAGQFVKIKGLTRVDSFDKELSISSVAGIKKIPDFTTKRADDAPRKRVELHCHTKMSDMDAVSDTKDIIRCAYRFGHPAIAITDHGVVQAFTDAFHLWSDLWKEASKKAGRTIDRQDFFKIIYGMEAYLVDDLGEDSQATPNSSDNQETNREETTKQTTKDTRSTDDHIYKKLPYYHAILLAKNDLGRMNLYRLTSMSHLETFYKRPRILKSQLMQYREGLILGSACEAGELFRAILKQKSQEDIARIARFYDYLEIQPTGNNRFLIRDEKYPDIQNEEDLQNLNRRIVELGDLYQKPVVATCDVHFLNPEDEIYRRIIMTGKGFDDADEQPPLYLHTTQEMLDEFSYLGRQKAQEVVIDNTNLIADWVDSIDPVRPDRCPPSIARSDQLLTDLCTKQACTLYGEDLPTIVKERLDKELHSIISHGFAVMYIIAQRLVAKSLEDGYLVGSRGSVGSSFVATMAGITEVNPLPPHYLCRACKYSDFESELVRSFAGSAGIDMPDAVCPRCGAPLFKDGFDIPFETFLGFKGDKEPDIDLNFSGEYQSNAHKYTEVLFGKGQTFRAGTISTLADKTAYGFVKKYFESKEIQKRACEIDRITQGCTGIRKSTGQHPGGIVVVPNGEDINSFTPIQHPANDQTTDTITTHFDYHSIDHNLLKLDILGHDDP
ncbi:MAG: PHP domain-containing protein, partial [Clostridium sp.]|nr:PHP domain-containing protein [Clostridium sp.]